ncbi:MAG TPA: oligopeptide transporter, OPT family [Pyrinomonadaceae bacterium]|nr:oligopeptide transporter, OPT family [Pyrinomonadaceae bacterium]
MPSERIDAVDAAAAVEFPDRIGFKPDNPYLESFRPYIPPEVRLRELTPIPLIMGTLLGMVFGASSLYLVLKVGLTVSASIPVAVISITLFRLFSKVGLRDATILENNIVQTAGSAGESIAFGVGVTMPAIMILGMDLEITRVMLVALLGGLLGILMMIPLRRALIVAQHGYLKYPEGTACAEVLKAGASDESRQAAAKGSSQHAGAVDEAEGTGAKTIFAGLGVGFLYQVLMTGFKGWKDTPEKIFGAPFKAGSISAEISPALLGVGYIIGPRIASIMCAGGVLAYLVLIPAIKFFGSGMTGALPPGTVPISEMSPGQIRGAYVLYIGAGAVAAGGIISLFRSLPTIWHGLKGGLADLRGGQAAAANTPRTDQDLSMKFVVCGIIALVGMIMAFPQLGLQVNIFVAFLGALLIVAFGFLFVTVSSRLTGEIGSSSNPISGMTVATLLLTCLIFLLLGWTGPNYYITALSIGGIVCIASSNGGTTSQDLKTGFLVGSTPKYQQIAILIGAFASALVLGPILLLLNDSATVYVPRLSFEAATKNVMVDPGRASSLPAFTDQIKPNVPGNYRILKNEAGATAVAGLDPGEYLVDGNGKVVYKVEENFPPTLKVNPAQAGAPEKLKGPQANSDPGLYRSFHKTDTEGGPAGRYLVNDQGVPVYLADPGINGIHKTRPDGSQVTKYDAPKATLMSYIIKGILNRQLPWGLVLLGVMIAIVLEMSGIPSLAFAVGVYLPLSSSSPIFIGGMIRWLVDKYLRNKLKHKNFTEDQLVAETDKSPGVLMASGYIAGGALAAIVIAILQGVPKQGLANFNKAIEDWSTARNPLFGGGNADMLSMIPFLVLMLLLYLVGREVILRTRSAGKAD